MLTITKLKGAEYLISAVGQGVEDYYVGAREAPGVWQGQWAAALGLEGVVDAEALRALVNGVHPESGADLLSGHRQRKVRAIDVTLSCPKSVSVLWALGSTETSAAVSIAVVEATSTAVGFLEERATFARVQQNGTRRRVATGGFAVATFAHRTSRAGDPQLHTHCLIPNVVRRDNGDHVAFDANPLHTWGKATGTVFLNELERILTARLGVAWGPERNGIREMVGFTREQLRVFSKRTTAIETELEAAGEVVFDSKRQRMKADDRASLATRQRKDPSVTGEQLRQRWVADGARVGLRPGAAVDDLVVGRAAQRTLSPDVEVFAALVDPKTGLCATESRFCEAQVVERIAALSAGRLTLEEIVALSRRFLGSERVVRLAPDVTRRRPAEWSTAELRAVEDRLLARLDALAVTPAAACPPETVDQTVTTAAKPLGEDQVEAVRVLCGAGPSVRVLVAPAGFGKTTTVHAAAVAAQQSGRPVVAVAPTHRATAELRNVGLDAHTVARLIRNLPDNPLAANATVIVDEMSQLGTRDAAALLDAVAATNGAQVWFVGDVRQAQSVAAGGLAAELEHLATQQVIPAAGLVVNRRQEHPAERAALDRFRAGDTEDSQTIRADSGWEHQLTTGADTRHALAQAAVADADRHGVDRVAVLAVSHDDCEDLADRIRAVRAARGELRGPTLCGPGWGTQPRTYAAGDRILAHTNTLASTLGVFNGASGTVHHVDAEGMDVVFDAGPTVRVDAGLVAGRRADGTPNLSHGWARTVDGAQGGTWRQVHLLGTPTLDAQRGYVGQSRGQLPTHTWNIRPDVEHPHRLLADQRTPAETVLGVLGRQEPKTFAAIDDPSILDRQLGDERKGHIRVIRGRPPDVDDALEAAQRHADHAAREHDGAVRGLAYSQRQRQRLTPAHRLRRGGRADIAHADTQLAHAHQRIAQADAAHQHAQAEVARLQHTVAARAAWDQEHGWRLDRVTHIDDLLAHHWAQITLQAARADDPLAFGVDRLRNARLVFNDDLQRLNAGLPPDRRRQLEAAQGDLQRAHEQRRTSVRNLTDARTDLLQARQRHWGRRDKTAIGYAEHAVAGAEHQLTRTASGVDRAQQAVDAEQAAVRTLAAALRATAQDRNWLTAAVADIDAALDHTRVDRVLAAVSNPTHELWQSLGPPPETGGGRVAWCGIAERVEAWHDHHTGGRAGQLDNSTLGSRPRYLDRDTFDDTRLLVDHAHQIIAAADAFHGQRAVNGPNDPASWTQAVETGRDIAIPPPTQVVDRGLSLGL